MTAQEKLLNQLTSSPDFNKTSQLPAQTMTLPDEQNAGKISIHSGKDS